MPEWVKKNWFLGMVLILLCKDAETVAEEAKNHIVGPHTVLIWTDGLCPESGLTKAREAIETVNIADTEDLPGHQQEDAQRRAIWN